MIPKLKALVVHTSQNSLQLEEMWCAERAQRALKGHNDMRGHSDTAQIGFQWRITYLLYHPYVVGVETNCNAHNKSRDSGEHTQYTLRCSMAVGSAISSPSPIGPRINLFAVEAGALP